MDLSKKPRDTGNQQEVKGKDTKDNESKKLSQVSPSSENAENKSPSASLSDTIIVQRKPTYKIAVSDSKIKADEKKQESGGKTEIQKETKVTSKPVKKSLKHKDDREESEGTKGIDEDVELIKKNLKEKSSLDSEECEEVALKDQKSSESKVYYACWFFVTTASFVSRLFNIAAPAHICWDETHFGKMGSYYINRTFFFDVHPPLGKMLIGFAGVVTGYDGSFAFNKPGDEYGDVEYVGMRVFCAVLGSLLVPLSYQIVWHLTHSMSAGIFAASFVIFDTGTLILSRHILLDPILMFFIMVAVYCNLKFLSYKASPFSFIWWFWLSASGVFLACAIGVKFVGLFVILLIGYTTASDLWNSLADLSLSLFDLFKHLAARASCLIALPLVIYIVFFEIHFKVLNHSGSGDGLFSSAFQSELIGNNLHKVNMPQYIAYGSVITLKQRRSGGGYLHSHAHLYPDEHPPKQQQVTTYGHKDENNKWMIKRHDREVSLENDVEYVTSGQYVRLEHIQTHRNLHSHMERAPLSQKQYQVSGYGESGLGDANDIWRIELEGGKKDEYIETVKSKIRFVHLNVHCVLHSHDKKLPKWGWEQNEVTCNPNSIDSKTTWNVEEVVDSRLPNISFEIYSPSLIEKFLESHAVMTQGNSGLKPKEGEITSRPWQWPIDLKGQTFSGRDHRIYLLGNPVVFWALLVLKALFLLFWCVYRVKQKRNNPINKHLQTYCDRTFKVCWWLLLGWFLHYAPFWPMTRVLYFHHYFPAFLFSAMFGGVILDFIVTLLCICVPEDKAIKLFHWSIVVVLGGLCFSFYLFCSLAYGMSGPQASDEKGSMYGLKWLDSWEI